MLFGRGRELDRLGMLLAGDRPLVAVAGEPGIGKTALVREAIAASGRPAFQGGAFATLSWLPFLPLTQAVGREAGVGDVANAVAVVERQVHGGALLFLDDLQWADAPTLQAVGALRGRVPLVVAIRRGTPGLDNALAAVEGAELLELGALDDEAAHEVLRLRRPTIGAASARRVVAAAGGNPLLLEELAEDAGVSESLRLALAARIRALDDAARETMSMLSLAARPLERARLDAVDALLDAGLATATGSTVAPRHSLLAEAMAAMLDDPTRARVHARLAEIVPTIGEKARHLAAAGRTDAAFDAARRAADEAATPGERVAHLELAARCAPEGAEALRLEAAEAMAHALMMRELAEFLDTLDPPDAQSRARVELHRSFVALDLGDPAGAEQAVDRGLALVRGTGSTTEGLLLSRKAVLTKLLHNRPDESIALAHAGLELTDESDRPRALSTLAWMQSEAGADADWVTGFLDAVAAAQAVGNPAVELMARWNLCGCLAGTLTPMAAQPHVTDAVERARTLRLREWERSFASHDAVLARRAGDYERVLEITDEYLGEQLQDQLRAIFLIERAEALLAVGRFAEAEAALDAVDTLSVRTYQIGQARTIRAELERWSGRAHMAIERVDAVLGEARDDYAYLRAQLGLIRAWAAFDAGIADELPNEAVLTDEDELRNREVGAIRSIAGVPAAASARFEELAAAWAPASRSDELRCRWAAGEAARRAGDRQRALTQLRVAEERATVHGMAPLLARIRRSLRLLGERRDAARKDAGGLTEREREVLALVGDGLTNAEIARRLGTSVPTVARQIATASRKLGAETRAQAAALAASEQ